MFLQIFFARLPSLGNTKFFPVPIFSVQRGGFGAVAVEKPHFSGSGFHRFNRTIFFIFIYIFRLYIFYYLFIFFLMLTKIK